MTRTAYQRLYDMILSHGVEEVYENKEKATRYKFFTEFAAQHGDAIYGLDRPLMHLVNAFKSRRQGLRHRTARACSCTARSARPKAPSPGS